MKHSAFLTRILALALAIPLLYGSAYAEDVVTGTDTTESINRILRRIEVMAGVLALNETLNAEQTSSLLDDLTELHNDVKGLRQANELLLQFASKAIRENVVEDPAPVDAAGNLAPPEPVAEQATPELPPAMPEPQMPQTQSEDPPVESLPLDESVPAQVDEGTTPAERIYDKWEPYLDFDLQLSEEGAKYNGWVKDSVLNLGWSDLGQLRMDIQNGYQAVWTIREEWIGSPNATVTTASGGLITIQVRDEDGVREFEIRNGGLGPIFRRWILETEVSGDPA